MRVVAAVNEWPGEPVLDATATAATVLEAWTDAAPASEIVAIAQGDGGPRTADAWEGTRSVVGGAVVTPHNGALWLSPAQGGVRWNPLDLSAALLGLAATGVAETVVVPVGDVPPAGDAADLWGGALVAIKKALAGLDVVALGTSRRPLLGFHGMSAALIDGREGDEALAVAAQAQEERWSSLALEADAVAARSSLLGPSRLSDHPGSGAAGGLAYALAALGARVLPASHYLAEASGLAAAATDADLVVGIGGPLNPAALDEGVASSIAAVAARGGVPATMLSTAVMVGRRDLMAAGLASAHEAAAGRAGLADGVRRVAQTWVRE